MDIILVYWKVKPDRESDFLRYWKEGSLKGKPEGLIAEYLSKLEPDETTTWQLGNPDALVYVNVGLWENKSFWKKAFPNPPSRQPFEDSERERVWFSVKETH